MFPAAARFSAWPDTKGVFCDGTRYEERSGFLCIYFVLLRDVSRRESNGGLLGIYFLMVIPGWAGSHFRLSFNGPWHFFWRICNFIFHVACTIMYAYCLSISDAAAIFSFKLVSDQFCTMQESKSYENTNHYQNFHHCDSVASVSISIQAQTVMSKCLTPLRVPFPVLFVLS